MKKSTKKTKISTIQILKYRKPAGKRKNSHRVDFIFSCTAGGMFADPVGYHYQPGNCVYKNGQVFGYIFPEEIYSTSKNYAYKRLFAKEALHRYFK